MRSGGVAPLKVEGGIILFDDVKPFYWGAVGINRPILDDGENHNATLYCGVVPSEGSVCVTIGAFGGRFIHGYKSASVSECGEIA